MYGRRVNRLTNFINLIACVLMVAGSALAALPGLERVRPEQVGMDSSRLEHIDDVVQNGLKRGRMPGCVVLIGRANRIVFLKAYGYRRLQPTNEPMTTDTVFDLASLTKPIATATSVMLLVERGKLRLDHRAVIS